MMCISSRRVNRCIDILGMKRRRDAMLRTAFRRGWRQEEEDEDVGEGE